MFPPSVTDRALNDAQLSAATHDSGPLLIVAGAGTGKTKTLVARLAHLIERGNPAQDCYAYLRTTITEAIAAGRFPPELCDPDLVAQVFMGGTHGIVSLHIARGKDPWVNWRPVEQRAQLLIEGLIRGLTVPPSVSPGHQASPRPDMMEDLT